MSGTLATVMVLNCVLGISAIQVTPGVGLTFTYTFNNNSDRVAFVFNRLHRTRDGKGFPVPEPALVNITTEDDRVIISKRLLPVPLGLSVESRNIPCMTRVDPGGSIQEVVTVPMPAGLVAPYLRAEPFRGIVETRPAYFDLGFFLAYPGRESVVPIIDTAVGPVPCLDAFSDAAQQVLRVGPLTEAFQLRR